MISVSIQQVITTLSKTNIDPAIIKSLKTFLVLPADQKSRLDELNDPNSKQEQQHNKSWQNGYYDDYNDGVTNTK